MGKDIQVSTSKKGDIAVISIKGDVTAETGGIVDDAYQDESIINSPKILFEFNKNCYINSGGLAFLIEIASQGRKKNQKINAFGLSDHFQKIFHMIGITRCIKIFQTEESALEDFQSD